MLETPDSNAPSVVLSPLPQQSGPARGRGEALGALRVALVYAVFSAAWIVLSDDLVEALVGDPSRLTHYQTLKGLAFVATSAVLVYWLARAAGVAAQKRHEAHLGVISERVSSATLNCIGEAVLLIEPTGRVILDANAHGESLFGLQGLDLIGRDLATLFADEADFHAFMVEARARIDAGAQFRGSCRMRRRDGTVLETEHVIQAMDASVGRRGGIIDVVRDVTAHAMATRALRQQEEQYRLLAVHSLDIIWSMDLELRFQYVSPAVTTLLGYQPEEMIGTVLGHYVEPGELARLTAIIQLEMESMDTGPEGTLVETWMRHRNGSLVPVEVHGFIRRDHRGAPTGIQGSTRDIRQRLESASALRALVHRLKTLGRIDEAIRAGSSASLLFHVGATEARDTLEAGAVSILRLVEPDHRLIPVANVGFRTDLGDSVELHLDEGLIGEALVERRSTGADDILAPGSRFARPDIAEAEGFRGFAMAPMIARGRVLGVIAAFRRHVGRFTPDLEEFLGVLAGQVAVGVLHVESYRDLETANEQLLLAYDENIEAWSRALDQRDHETQGHSQRVTAIAVKLAQHAGIEGRELRYLRWGALLHDIGKMGIPDAILRKAGPLTPEEWAIVQQHPVIARDLLLPIRYLAPAIAIPYSHHERWDGQGYPLGLAGKDIPLAARLFAVVDVFDAMRSTRPYRQGWGEARVLRDLRARAGSHLDPELVELFCSVMAGIPEARDPVYVTGDEGDPPPSGG